MLRKDSRGTTDVGKEKEKSMLNRHERKKWRNKLGRKLLHMAEKQTGEGGQVNRLNIRDAFLLLLVILTCLQQHDGGSMKTSDTFKLKRHS